MYVCIYIFFQIETVDGTKLLFFSKSQKNATQFIYIYIYMKLCRTLVNATQFPKFLSNHF